MAKALKITIEVGATEGGATVLEMEDTFEGTVDDVNKHTLRIPNGSDKFVAVQGTDLTDKTDPMVLGLVTIRGLFVKSAVALGIQIDGAVAEVIIGPGASLLNNLTAATVELSNSSGQPADIQLAVWGDR